MEFKNDLASRLANRVQLTNDGHRADLEAVEGVFGRDVDYAKLVKIYGTTITASGRDSPDEYTGIRWRTVESRAMPNTSRPAMSSARTPRCGCTCASLPA